MQNNKVKGLFLIVSLVILLTSDVSLLFAQNEAATPAAEDSSAVGTQRFEFALDMNRFRYADSLTYLEYSIAIFQSMLQFVETENNQYMGKFMVSSELVQGDSVISQKEWMNANTVDSLGQINYNQRLYTISSFVLNPGDYKLKVKVSDPNNENSVARGEFPVKIDPFDNEKLLISDVQFASSISRSEANNPFVKNGFQIIPNPSYLYGIGLPMLYCYAEVYNLVPSESDSGQYYGVSYTISDRDGKEVKSLPEKLRKKPGKSSVEVNSINVVTLVSGPYTLNTIVEDKGSGQKANFKRKFYVYRDGDFKEGGELYANKEEITGEGSAGLDAHRYDVMSEKEIDKEFDIAKYIATREEKSTYKRLNHDGKKEFIRSFWSRRDRTPGTDANEFKEDYLGRVKKANNNYKGGFKEGWKSDRGRILLIYGEPDEVERHPSGMETRPYEIWQYHYLQGGVAFAFVDRRGMGDFELVHSTARGELYDAQWQRWIYPDNESTYNSNMY